MTLSPIIEAQQLKELLGEEKLIIIDATGTQDALNKYLIKHIHGALYIDQDTELADIKPNVADGGRHPLPTPAVFCQTLTRLGISTDSHVVVYDEKNASSSASRFWWMMLAAGHKKIQVLNGGLMAAEKAGLPTDNAFVAPKSATPYLFDAWKLPIVGMQDVAKATNSQQHTIIDVRDAYRYNGESEPIDLIAGHIPGAINIPYSENLGQDGLYLSPETLKVKYLPLVEKYGAENIIVHCGSGVTACHTLLAMAYAGLSIPALYVGSWSEWSRNSMPLILKQ